MLNLALVHYPVYNKNKEIVTSSIVNLDLHDISRICKTYKIGKFFIINPLEKMLEIVSTLTKHWTYGYGSTANPDRKMAVEVIYPVKYIEDIYNVIDKNNVITYATCANPLKDTTSILDCSKKIIQNKNKEHLIFFGTGYGLTNDIINNVDYIIEPIQIFGKNSYNHLAVRSAVAIIIDRLYTALQNLDKEFKNGTTN